MPLKLPDALPARQLLEREGIPGGTARRSPEIPVRIAILNLMPTKLETETQILRLLNHPVYPVEISLLRTASYASRNTPAQYMQAYYQTFDEIRHQQFDGLIITGAPVEQMDFEQVCYWQELTQILEWAQSRVKACLYLCWGAQAALYHYFGVPKHALPQKLSGVFEHTSLNRQHQLLQGFDDVFHAPHSRFTENRRQDIESHPELEIIAESDEAGVHMVASRNGQHVFITGHPEYDWFTLHKEYERDSQLPENQVAGDIPRVGIPRHYYRNDQPGNPPVVKWRSHAQLLFSNWLNYFVI